MEKIKIEMPNLVKITKTEVQPIKAEQSEAERIFKDFYKKKTEKHFEVGIQDVFGKIIQRYFILDDNETFNEDAICGFMTIAEQLKFSPVLGFTDANTYKVNNLIDVMTHGESCYNEHTVIDNFEKLIPDMIQLASDYYQAMDEITQEEENNKISTLKDLDPNAVKDNSHDALSSYGNSRVCSFKPLEFDERHYQ